MDKTKRFCCFIFLFWLFISTSFAQQHQLSQVFYLYTMIGENTPLIELKEAKALTVDLSGSIYIADTGNHRIIKLNSDGDVIKIIGGLGWEKEQFYSPSDINASYALDIYVADYYNHRIQRFDKYLNYIASLYSNENWEPMLQFGYPKSITISIHGDLFIIDGENNRIVKFNTLSAPEISFGDYGEGKGRLLQPIQAMITPDDIIYVSDSQGNKIIVYDYFGNYLTEIGSNYLKEPKGIFYSPLNLLFVADQGNKRIAVFKSNGDLLFSWSKISDKIGSFKNPADVVNFKNKVYVLDNDQIFVFELK